MATDMARVTLVNTAGEALMALLPTLDPIWFTGISGLGPPTFEVTLDTFIGLRRMNLVYTGPVGDSFTWWSAVVLSQGESQLISARELVMQPGFNTAHEVLAYGGPTTAGGNFSVAALQDIWKQVIVVAKAAVVDSWSDGVPADPVYLITDNDPEGIQTCVAVTTIQGLGQHYVSQDVFHGVLQFGSTTPGISVNPPELSMQQPMVMVAGVGELARAIDAITNQDIEVSMNQGAFVYSVKSKVVVGP